VQDKHIRRATNVLIALLFGSALVVGTPARADAHAAIAVTQGATGAIDHGWLAGDGIYSLYVTDTAADGSCAVAYLNHPGSPGWVRVAEACPQGDVTTLVYGTYTDNTFFAVCREGFNCAYTAIWDV
jgi:hypothetical protein